MSVTPLDQLVLPYVGGQRTAPGSSATFELVNPATGEAIGEVATSDQAQVDAAVDAARDAQRSWVKLSPERRGALMWRWGELVLAEAAELAAMDTATMGKPLHVTVKEAPAITARIC
jgi:acyl-CoA reductase-like NAD-dependent aldehyde dehydrogenase